MATKNIVPNADTEGQLGTSTKGWGKIFLGGTAANIDVNDVSGTNTAGKSLTLISGASTGSGSGGSLVFQTAAAGGSGTSVNSHATVLTLDSAKLATFTGGLDIAGAVDIAGDLTLSAGADGALNFSAASSIKILDNSATSLVIEEADTAYMTFVTTNSSEAIKFDKALDINAAVQLDSTLTVGVNDTGYDVKFFGATINEGVLYDTSEDELGLLLTTKLKFHDIGGGEEIFASANGHLEINAGTTLDITAPTVDVNGTMDVSGAFTNGSTLVSTGKITADAGIDIDNFNIDGTTIALSSGDLTLDSAADIVFDAAGDNWLFKTSGTTILEIQKDQSNVEFKNLLQNGDIKFRGVDGSANITALTLDMSAAGAATFSGSVASSGQITSDALIKTGAQFKIAPNSTDANNVYNIVDADNTYTGVYVMQGGGGSNGYGGSLACYGHSHASRPGFVSAGISSGSGGKFTVMDQANNNGGDVFAVDANGYAKLDGGGSQSILELASSKGLGSLVAGNALGEIRFNHDLTSASGALIIAAAQENSASGQQNHGAELGFYTAANGNNTTTPAIRLKIDNAGTLTGTDTDGIGALSDERLKENIADYTGGLALLKQLRPRTFEWKNTTKRPSQTGTRRGFIAQEINAVDTYWVAEINSKDSDDVEYNYTSDTEKTYTTKLQGKDAMYVSAIKELVAEIEALKERVETLEG